MISININGLEGDLHIPYQPKGLVLFAHGSGSSRHSPRNQLVAKYLNDHKIATLLIDLLTPEEDQNIDYRFNIGLLAKRLLEIVHFLFEDEKTKTLPLALFGASTGAAAALITAAKIGPKIKAVVSRGGRTDLAMNYLASVQSPTLFIVGGFDTAVLELNQRAFTDLTCEKRLEIIPRATHLFEEKGALEEVARLSSRFFLNHL